MSDVVFTCADEFQLSKSIQSHDTTWRPPGSCVKLQVQSLPLRTLTCYLLVSRNVVILEVSPCSRVLLEKVTVFQVVKKFPTFYGTRKFITAFTSARHLSLSWASSTHSIPLHPNSWRSILILSSHLRLRLTSGFFLQVSPPKPCIRLSSPPYALHAPPISFFSILSPDQY
jgi:hypothetical protein